jgi:catechol 2,3-dioxygenase-like lactoylglutathione lyase family enzyme
MAHPLRIYQTSFVVSDLDRSVAFYCDVLGMKKKNIIQPESAGASIITGYPGVQMRIAQLMSGDHEIELIQYLSPQGAKRPLERKDLGAAHIAFQVEDIHAVYNNLVAKGVRFVNPPHGVRTAFACYFYDPDGITLELIQRL